MEITLTVRARFFSGQPIETREVIVETDGTIRVWDNVAGYYTTCHSLTRSAVRRIRKLARPCPLCGTHHERGDGPQGYSCAANH